MRYSVWTDNESKVEVYKDFNSLEKACDFASDFVHKYDGKPYRVITYIEDNKKEESVGCYENINPCDGPLYTIIKFYIDEITLEN